MTVFIHPLGGGIQPLGDGFLPNIGLIAAFLFLDCILDDLGFVQPPSGPGPAEVEGLGPKLVAIAAQPLEVDLAAPNGPETAAAGFVL